MLWVFLTAAAVFALVLSGFLAAAILAASRRSADTMDAATERLLEKVTAIETVTESVTTIIAEAVQIMRDNAADEAAINAAADRLESVSGRLANATIEGTPAVDDTAAEEPVDTAEEEAADTMTGGQGDDTQTGGAGE